MSTKDLFDERSASRMDCLPVFSSYSLHRWMITMLLRIIEISGIRSWRVQRINSGRKCIIPKWKIHWKEFNQIFFVYVISNRRAWKMFTWIWIRLCSGRPMCPFIYRERKRTEKKASRTNTIHSQCSSAEWICVPKYPRLVDDERKTGEESEWCVTVFMLIISTVFSYSFVDVFPVVKRSMDRGFTLNFIWIGTDIDVQWRESMLCCERIFLKFSLFIKIITLTSLKTLFFFTDFFFKVFATSDKIDDHHWHSSAQCSFRFDEVNPMFCSSRNAFILDEVNSFLFPSCYKFDKDRSSRGFAGNLLYSFGITCYS